MRHILTVFEANDMAQNRPLWRSLAASGQYALLVQARNDDDNNDDHDDDHHDHDWCGNLFP